MRTDALFETLAAGPAFEQRGRVRGAIGTANFGKITSAADGRVVQFGVKYIF